MLKFRVRVVVDYADTQICTLRSNIFAKSKNFAEPFLPVHMEPWSPLRKIFLKLLHCPCKNLYTLLVLLQLNIKYLRKSKQ